MAARHPYHKEFIGRVRAARETRYPNQTAIACVLDIPQGKYKQYEVRSLMPLELIPRFAKACGVTVGWLVDGEGPGPKWEPYVHKPKKRNKLAKRRKVA